MALGSGRRAVIRQLLVESAVLALGGGALGLFVGWGVLGGAHSAERRRDSPRLPGPAGRARPRHHAARGARDERRLRARPGASREPRRRAGGAGGVGHARGRGRPRPARAGLLVVGEVAMGVVLLVSAGLLVRTFVHLRSLNPGFDPTSVTTATISLQDKRYEDPVKVNRLFADTLAGIRRQPGVEAAGVTLGPSIYAAVESGLRTGGRGDRQGQGGNTNLSYITPGMSRRSASRSARGARSPTRIGPIPQPVAIVNEEFVRRYYKGQDVVGLRHPRGRRSARDRRRRGERARDRLRSRQRRLAAHHAVCRLCAGDADERRMFKLVHTWFSPSWVVRSSGPIAGLPEGDPAVRRRRRSAAADREDGEHGGRAGGLARAAALHDVGGRRPRRRRAAAGGDRHPRPDRQLRERAHAGARDPSGAGREQPPGPRGRRQARPHPGRRRRRDRQRRFAGRSSACCSPSSGV